MASVLKTARLAALALLALAAAGCASAGRNASRPQPRPVTVHAGDIRFDTLEPQELAPGQCGLFLWAHAAEQPAFILVAYSNPAEAHVRANGRDRTLRRTSFEGPIQHGAYERQTFSDRRLTLSVEVHFDPARQLRGGAVLERGVIRMRDEEGWETIVPVGGMAACQS